MGALGSPERSPGSRTVAGCKRFGNRHWWDSWTWIDRIVRDSGGPPGGRQRRVDAFTPMSGGMDWTSGGRVSQYFPIMDGQPSQSPPRMLKTPGMGVKWESTSPQGAGVQGTVISPGRPNLGLGGVPASRRPGRFTNMVVPRFDETDCWQQHQQVFNMMSQGLSEYYNSPGRLAVFRRKFDSVVCRDGEDPAAFTTELEILVRGFRDVGPQARTRMVRDRFISEQRSCGLRRHLDSVPPNTPIWDIVNVASVGKSR